MPQAVHSILALRKGSPNFNADVQSSLKKLQG